MQETSIAKLIILKWISKYWVGVEEWINLA
jgi:hypothetical protein